MKTFRYMNLLISLCVAFAMVSCSDDEVSPEPDKPVVATDGGYLFAHMTDANYGSIFYSVSRDGYNWQTLNDGRTILPAYVGHPDICQGRDGVYYMISVKKNVGIPLLWSSEDLVTWKSTKLAKSIFNKITALYGYKNEETYYGAPKMFYDEPSDQYIITWHAGTTGNDGDADEWASKRTFYILTSDFKNFTEPKFLFNFTGSDADMATIDVIIRREGDTYYAIMKDERTQEVAPETGKTIRIAKSKNLTGPYSNPGPRITPLTPWHEAHTIVPKVNGDGFFLYTEDYTRLQYDMFEAESLDGTWKERYFPGPKARHGCVIRINETEYQAILTKYTGANAGTTEQKYDLEFSMPDNTAYAIDGKAKITVNIAGGKKADERITLKLVPSTDAKGKLSMYNTKYGSEFDIMPESAFKTADAIIEKGASGATFDVEVNLDYLSQNFAGKPFLLPVTVEGDDNCRCRTTGYVAGPVIRKDGDAVNIYTYGSTPTAKVYNTGKTTDKAVIGIPGGGYGALATNEIAHFKELFQNRNITVAVVYYRMPNGNHAVPATDAYNVLKMMIKNSKDWGGYSKIGLIGGSAGAHVATTLSSYVPEMIDFQVLLYPLITMNPAHTHEGSYKALLRPATKALEDAFSSELHVTSATPPAYIGYSLDDDIVDPVWNGQAYAKALEKNGVRYIEKSHPTGGHWVGSWTDYPESLYEWLETIK